MELDVVIHIADACFHGGDQRQLFIINVLHQLRVVVVTFCRPGTGQVSRIAVIFCPGIQQEAAHLFRCLMVQFGVMQYRSVFVKRHNVAVRYVGITMTGRGQIGNVDIELAHARTERFFCRAVTVDRHFLRFTHTGQFVLSFEGAIVMQVVDNPFRVDVAGLNTQLQRTFRHRTDITDIAARSRQQATNAIGFRQRDHFYIFSPEGVRQRFDVVPVINRQIEPQFRLVHAIHQQPAVWHLSYRHPRFELRVHFKRIGMIVEKNVEQFAGVNK